MQIRDDKMYVDLLFEADGKFRSVSDSAHCSCTVPDMVNDIKASAPGSNIILSAPMGTIIRYPNCESKP